MRTYARPRPLSFDAFLAEGDLAGAAEAAARDRISAVLEAIAVDSRHPVGWSPEETGAAKALRLAMGTFHASRVTLSDSTVLLDGRVSITPIDGWARSTRASPGGASPTWCKGSPCRFTGVLVDLTRLPPREITPALFPNLLDPSGKVVLQTSEPAPYCVEAGPGLEGIIGKHPLVVLPTGQKGPDLLLGHADSEVVSGGFPGGWANLAILVARDDEGPIHLPF